MKIIFFAHPNFLSHQSMPRFAHMLSEGMKARGHEVEVWMPKAVFFRLPVPAIFRKWMSYIDQYLVFPFSVRKKIKKYASDTLFVFTDHALGPWVPLVSHRPHIIHCHDFLAQQAALDKIPESPISKTGKLYQKFIRKGYTKGRNFISVSQKTKNDLHTFLVIKPLLSEVVYNGLNQEFKVLDPIQARELFARSINVPLNTGYVLHVGGNQWYKNRIGIIDVYDAWRITTSLTIPLILIGEVPNLNLLKHYKNSIFKKDIHFISGLDDETVRNAYAGATVFLFPSLAEGFGWPIAEAMASGVPVITTNEAPMTEVAGDAGFLIPKRPFHTHEIQVWATESAGILKRVMVMSTDERSVQIQKGFINAQRFNTDDALNKIEHIYKDVLSAF